MIFNSAFNPLNAELNPICHLLALLGAHHIFHVSVLTVKGLTSFQRSTRNSFWVQSGQLRSPKTVNQLLPFKTKPGCFLVLYLFAMTGILYRQQEGSSKIPFSFSITHNRHFCLGAHRVQTDQTSVCRM